MPSRPFVVPTLSCLAFAGTILAFAPPAAAGIEACGNIQIDASASCEVRVGAECRASCTPVSFEVACAADLVATCDGMCTASADVTCTTDCNPNCLDTCTVDPGAFDCQASCYADCEGSCDASCAAAGDQGKCRASCEATCSADCDANCNVVPPSATCEEQCNACCTGTCEAEANLDCQIDCQATLYADCEAMLQGGCEAECDKPEGALFCDGQYIDHGGNLAECVDALRELLGIMVEGYAEGSCSNGSCSGEAGGTLSCGATIDPSGRRHRAVVFGVLVALAGAGAARRRRR